MQTHFWGPLYTMAAALPHMQRQRGEADRQYLVDWRAGRRPSSPSLQREQVRAHGTLGRARRRADAIRRPITTVCPGLMRTGSTYQANFKGRHRQEFAWFHVVRLPAGPLDRCGVGSGADHRRLPARRFDLDHHVAGACGGGVQSTVPTRLGGGDVTHEQVAAFTNPVDRGRVPVGIREHVVGGAIGTHVARRSRHGGKQRIAGWAAGELPSASRATVVEIAFSSTELLLASAPRSGAFQAPPTDRASSGTERCSSVAVLENFIRRDSMATTFASRSIPSRVIRAVRRRKRRHRRRGGISHCVRSEPSVSVRHRPRHCRTAVGVSGPRRSLAAGRCGPHQRRYSRGVVRRPGRARSRVDPARDEPGRGLSLLAALRESAAVHVQSRTRRRERRPSLALGRERAGRPARRMGRRDHQRRREPVDRAGARCRAPRSSAPGRSTSMRCAAAARTQVSVHLQYAPPAGRAGALRRQAVRTRARHRPFVRTCAA